jgi:hypothetical protein
MTTRVLGSVFGWLLAASAVLVATACDFGYNDCYRYETRCRTVCDYATRTAGGQPFCYQECRDVCADLPAYGSYATRRDAGVAPTASTSDAGTARGLLCAACSSHRDCDEGALCLVLGRGGADAGASDGEGRCGFACSGATDCPSGYECLRVDSARQCVPKSRTCAPDRSAVPECSDESPCSADATCVKNVCRALCTSTDTCGPGELCGASGYCAPYEGAACGAGAAACARGTRCDDGRCTPICLDSVDCPKGWACTDGLCRAEERAHADAGR